MHTRPRGQRCLRTRVAALVGALLLTGATAVAAQAADAPATTAPDKAAQPAAGDFQQVTLAKGVAETGEPMTMAVLPDRSVLHTSRDGTLRLTDAQGNTKTAGRLDVYNHDEEGLQGVGVDPRFTKNHFVYLYYAPPLDTPEGDAPDTGTAADFEKFAGVNRLSRFVLRPDGTLDESSEHKVLDVPADRGTCCHVGGDIAFDSKGNLLLSTGDDSNPFQSDGYTPIDERADRNPAFDAQRSAGNTDDLRGKILRITVRKDGSYTIPRGNLFRPGTAKTRPEIYAMGFRNPFRMTVDKKTDTVYVGDYGPDAGTADPQRGPAGQVEFARVTRPGNYGWPYCTGKNDAYTDYDFATGTSGEKFDCAAPRNTSPRNTGRTRLPAAQPAWIPYDGDSVPEFGDGSESPMGGPVYRYDPHSDSPVAFPREYDGDFFAGEFGRRWIKRVEQDRDGGDVRINDFPWSGTQVMDMDFGPDGALYVLDYGTGYFNGDENSALYRIENATDGHSPVVEASSDISDGQAPLTVSFSAEATDQDGDTTELSWDFGDGATSDEAEPTHTYETNGTYTATVTAEDPSGRTGSASVHITVGNTAPQVELKLPADGQPFSFGDEIPFEVQVTDPEEEQIDCSRVEVAYILGHDSHGHPLTSAKGCKGTIKTLADGEHDPNADIFGVFDASYTDNGANGQPPLTSHGQSILQPKHRQAEHFTGAADGVSTGEAAGAEGGKAVTGARDGQWIAYEPYAPADVTQLTARVAGTADAALEVRADGPDGPLLGTAQISATDGWTEVSADLSGVPEDAGALCLVFTGGDGALYDLDSFTVTTG
ncbi:PQQ-dependent sugar dehydrogenase [Streptomyces qinglanensis]|uniref:Glucose/arabinose dehydrogenase, beta-propeller fold n=1 Tax=Streptomyces qinglanensis TaxID=943816 RepID=A0A1H9S712_9ACTN|nr:PQQ-dependent sugar dehydrogenase [Streptomyces qinglanensis]SER80760.1 Glucose/arabinose dehydrogenase, beta-propeller fold [Streptomyces qinglanensis]